MNLQRLSRNGVPAALFGAVAALASSACDDPGARRDAVAVRAEPSPDPPPPEQPAPPEEEEFSPDDPPPRPACFHDDWHYNGHCLARCRDEQVYTTVSQKREVDYVWCYVRAWNWCDHHGKDLGGFCWGVKDENWGHDWDDDCEIEEKI